MSEHPESEFASADEDYIPVPGWVIVLTGRIDWLLRWIFRFSRVSIGAFIGLILLLGIAATIPIQSSDPAFAASERADVWQRYYDSFGNLTDPLNDTEGIAGRVSGRDAITTALRLQDAAVVVVLLLPLWIAYRLALLPFWFIGKRLLKRSTSQSQAPT